MGGQDTSVGIATGYGLDGRDSNPDRDKVFLFSTTSRPAETHPPSYPMSTGGDFP
jgi:hypothetical protein